MKVSKIFPVYPTNNRNRKVNQFKKNIKRTSMKKKDFKNLVKKEINRII
jgi:hypothetical protein